MIKENDIPAGAWKLALAMSAAIWGGSFVVIKGALDVVPPSWLMFVRFLLASVLVAAVFWRKISPYLNARHIAHGAVLGALSGTAFVVQNLGLTTITPGTNAFLTATYCVMVPFVNWAVTRRLPGSTSVAAALLAVLGVGLLSLGDGFSFSLGVGEQLTLLSALLYALHIVAVARFSEGGDDVMTLTVVQLAVSAVVSLAFALALGEAMDWSVLLEPSMWVALGYLVILSSCVCMVLQNVGQAHVPPAQAALLLSLESVFAVIASVLFYGEVVTPRLAAGFATIFLAVVVSEVGPAVLAWLRGRLGRGAAGDAAAGAACVGGAAGASDAAQTGNAVSKGADA